MVKKKEKARMMDYLVSSLEGSGPNIAPLRNQNINGLEANCIQVGNEGVVLLVDQKFPGDSFRRLWMGAQSQVGDNVAIVFYKDGQTFFRNAAERNYFKKSKGLSLKHYSDDEMHRMILFQPEEATVNNRRSWLQYFQPESERLSEGLVSYKFNTVTYDYDHIDKSEGRFKPSNRESTKVFIWKEKVEHSPQVQFRSPFLVDRHQPQTMSEQDQLVYQRMLMIKDIQNAEERIYEAEGIAIQIENLDDNHPLSQAYQTLVAPYVSR